MRDPLYIPRWFTVLIEIYQAPDYMRYCQRLNREVKASINYLRAIVKLLEEKNLVEIIPTKNIHRIDVTEKGKRIAANILNITSELR